VLSGTAHKPELVACGEIRLPERLALAARLSRLHSGLDKVLHEHAPTVAAVEAPFHGASARSALLLAHARGVVLAVLGLQGVEVVEYSPATIKKAVTGNGRAEKAQVAAMVARLVKGGESSVRSDITDAIAAAVCHLFNQGHDDALRRAEASRPPRTASQQRH
jgi:crossover junction endodeoxyribonuclease RuvC